MMMGKVPSNAAAKVGAPLGPPYLPGDLPVQSDCVGTTVGICGRILGKSLIYKTS